MEYDLMLLFVKECDTIDIFQECPKCGGINALNSHICAFENCKTDLNAHPIIFCWKIFLTIPREQPYVSDYAGNYVFLYDDELVPCYQTRVFVSGPKLDPILGISCNDFMELSINHGFETMTYLLSKFFYNSKFLIARGHDRILRMYLPKGCQLTFFNWLSLQDTYGFNRDILFNETYYRRYVDPDFENEEDSSEKQEDKVYTVSSLLVSNFYQTNTKVFGESPFPIKSNIYDITNTPDLKDMHNDETVNELDNYQEFDPLVIPLENSVYG